MVACGTVTARGFLPLESILAQLITNRVKFVLCCINVHLAVTLPLDGT